MSIITLKDGSEYDFINIKDIRIIKDVLNAKIQKKERCRYIKIVIPIKSITKYNNIDFNRLN